MSDRNPIKYIHGCMQKEHYGKEDVEVCSCPLCASENRVDLYKERGMLGIVRCMDCGLLYTRPRAVGAEQNYFGDERVLYDEARLIFDGVRPPHRENNYLFELRHLKKFKPAGKLLDIGANMGFFVKKAREHGYDAEGVDPSPPLVRLATREFGVPMREAYFRKEDYQARSMDVITMLDVFEHITQPLKVLHDVHVVLKDDGILCIKVPNGNYGLLKLRVFRAMGRHRKHDIFNAYEHVAHYTLDTLTRMVVQEGFRVKKTIVPIPIHPPVWHKFVGHYYDHASPFMLDWKRIVARNVLYIIGKFEKSIGLTVRFAPDLMLILGKA